MNTVETATTSMSSPLPPRAPKTAARRSQDLHKCKPDLSYYVHPPETKWATLIWRWRIRFEATFAITVLEPWEKVAVVTFLALVFTLILYGIVKFVPAQLMTMQRRAVYYIWGLESDAHKFWSGLAWGKDATISTL